MNFIQEQLNRLSKSQIGLEKSCINKAHKSERIAPKFVREQIENITD